MYCGTERCPDYAQLQDGAKKRAEEELDDKKSKDEERAKLKAKMGVENVGSKIWSALQQALIPPAARPQEEEAPKRETKEKKERKDMTPEEVEEAKRKKEEIAARNK